MSPGQQFIQQQQPQSMGNHIGGGGPGTPHRGHTPMAPNIMISPSAPVRTCRGGFHGGCPASLPVQKCDDGGLICLVSTYPSTWRDRNNAWRPRSPESWTKVAHVQSPTNNAQRYSRRYTNSKTTTFFAIRYIGPATTRTGKVAWIP